MQENVHTTVLYHANCPDGFAAALACQLHLGETAQYLPVSYGQPPPPIPAGHEVLIVDFSYPKATLDDIAKQQFLHGTEQLTVLDHHKSAQEDLATIRDDHPRPNLHVHFDMEESGATLAWKYFQGAKHPDTLEIEMPRLFKYIRDRDLWRWQLPMSKEISLALGAYPRDFGLRGHIMTDMETDLGMRNLTREGTAIARYAARLVEEQATRVRWGYLDGHAVPYANTTTLFSEVGEALCVRFPTAPFSAYYFDHAGGQRQWGLRGHGKVDCSLVARHYGGGGHFDAAGFIAEAGWLPIATNHDEK